MFINWPGPPENKRTIHNFFGQLRFADFETGYDQSAHHCKTSKRGISLFNPSFMAPKKIMI